MTVSNESSLLLLKSKVTKFLKPFDHPFSNLVNLFPDKLSTSKLTNLTNVSALRTVAKFLANDKFLTKLKL